MKEDFPKNIEVESSFQINIKTVRFLYILYTNVLSFLKTESKTFWSGVPRHFELREKLLKPPKK